MSKKPDPLLSFLVQNIKNITIQFRALQISSLVSHGGKLPSALGADAFFSPSHGFGPTTSRIFAQVSLSWSFLTRVTLIRCGPSPCLQEWAISPRTLSHETYPMTNGCGQGILTPPEVQSQWRSDMSRQATSPICQSLQARRTLRISFAPDLSSFILFIGDAS